MSDIWKDPRVVEALKERSADDIAVLECPYCRHYGYYNEGSHFTCIPCNKTFFVASEDEEYHHTIPMIRLLARTTLADTADFGQDIP